MGSRRAGRAGRNLVLDGYFLPGIAGPGLGGRDPQAQLQGLQNGGKEESCLPTPFKRAWHSGAPGRFARRGARETDPTLLIPSMTLVRGGRSVCNRAMLISAVSSGRKGTKRSFHPDIIKLALNKHAARSHTPYAAHLHLLPSS